MEYHETANIFPLDEEHIADLAKDIRQHGLLRPIEVFEGKILDGRRRWLACEQGKVKPWTLEVHPEDPIAYVLSLNLHRRHLTTSQASMCAARARGLYDKRAKERQKAGGKAGRQKQLDGVPANLPEPRSDSRDQVGESFGISGKNVDRATRIQREGVSELVTAVDAGKLSVNKAVYIASHPEDVQRDLLKIELSREQTTQRKANTEKLEKANRKPPGELQGVGIIRANEAINCLTRIPKNDALRKRGFQLVTDWIKHNK